MSLSAGTQLGPYEILALLGAGGMGEVYRASDPRMGREVAIKLSADRFSNRFEREVRAVAALNHPNICQIYDVGPNYLVMELVEGPTLSDRIKQGAIPLEEVLSIAHQIADALAAAHEKAIIHRDLKPANVKIKADGLVKVLDFGLAKIAESTTPPENPEISPTLTIEATRVGQILGTAAYMSPEQARGKPVDKRADIWAFGVVLYEILTGDRLFHGEDLSETLAAVIKVDPDLSNAPPLARRLLQRCLEKDPKKRLRDIGDALPLLEEAGPAGQAPPTAGVTRTAKLPWTIAVLATVAAVAVWLLARQQAAEEHPIVFQISPPPGAQFVLGAGGGSAISPDGRTVAFVAASSGSFRKLWVRPLDSAASHDLAGTEGAAYPFWSPDSRSIGFFADEKLKRIDVSGGPPLALADATSPRGASWSVNGTIIYAPLATGGLMRVPAFGGKALPLTIPDRGRDESSHRWPQALIDGKRFLYFSQNVDATRRAGEGYLASFTRPQDRIRLTESRADALYAPPVGKRDGYLLWPRGSSLIAQTFDPASGRFSGEGRPVVGAERVAVAVALQLAEFSVSKQGTLAFQGGDDHSRLTWYNREGKTLGTVGETELYAAVRIAPDGKHVGASITDSNGRYDVWRIDLNGGAPSRLTFDGNGYSPVWSSDGRDLVYSSLGKAFQAQANGTSRGKEIIRSPNGAAYVTDWSPDGRYWLYSEHSADTLWDLWILPTGDTKSQPYLKTPYNELEGQFAPNGKWIAYTSDESGRNEIYVRAFPDSGAKFPVSNGGGRLARWRRDGKELFYRGLDGRLMAAPVRAAAQGLDVGSPVPLVPTMEPAGVFVYSYDISPDGQRILALAPAANEAGGSSLTVIVNWQAALKK
jgi:Tol biopolymer transport system component